MADANPAAPVPARAPKVFERALDFALAGHGSQTRKGTDAPYVSHLLQVSGLVLENGGDWEQAAAAVIHDSLEDVPGVTADAIQRRFGERVARIVRDCTDTLPGDTPGEKSPWVERKTRYLDQIAGVAPDSLLVAACDKRHNLGSIIADFRVLGPPVFERFSAPAEQQLLFYREFVRRAGDRLPDRLRIDLEALVSEFEDIVIAKYPVSAPGDA